MPVQWKSCYQASKTAVTRPSLRCQREPGKLMNDGRALLLVGSQSFSHQSYGMLEEKAWGSCPDAACWCLFSAQSLSVQDCGAFICYFYLITLFACVGKMDMIKKVNPRHLLITVSYFMDRTDTFVNHFCSSIYIHITCPMLL